MIDQARLAQALMEIFGNPATNVSALTFGFIVMLIVISMARKSSP